MKKLLLVWLILVSINSYSQIRYYPLDGNANELINNQTGIVGTGIHAPMPTTDRFGNPGMAFYFDGSDYISVSTTGLLNNAFSVSAWITIDNYPNFSARQNFFTLGDNVADHSVGVGNDQFGHGLFAAGYTTGSPYRLFQNTVTPLNNWFFFVATYSNDYVRLYIDGIEVDSASTAGLLPNYGTTPASYIGTRTPTSSGWRGKIDELKIYDYALPPNQTSGLNDLNHNNNALEIYPNPVLDILHINNLINDVSIINIQGQEVIKLNSKQNNNNIAVDISNLASGIYFLKDINKEVRIAKFVKL